MKENVTYKKEYPVYPGEYALLPESEAMLQALRIGNKNSAILPLVNMEEMDDCFKIDMLVPGSKREDVFIYIYENVLTVVVLHKDLRESTKKLPIHEFVPTCLERHILLPADADTEFISAEYRQGILSMHIPRNGQTTPSRERRQIVIY